MTHQVGIISTGIANIASVIVAFERLGCETRLIESPSAVESMPFVVLPGVGSFGHGMANLRRFDLCGALVNRIQQDQPTLAICLGLQLLCQSSDESPEVAGLGVLPIAIRRFKSGLMGSSSLRVPHLGWNEVIADSTTGIVNTGEAYFAHSYYAPYSAEGWQSTRCNYGSDFFCSFERGRVAALQFHPELSGAWGLGVLRRWLDGGPQC